MGVASTLNSCLEQNLDRWKGGYMSRKEIYEQKTESFIQPIVDKYHFELVDVEFVKEAGNWHLRNMSRKVPTGTYGLTLIRKAELPSMTVKW